MTDQTEMTVADAPTAPATTEAAPTEVTPTDPDPTPTTGNTLDAARAILAQRWGGDVDVNLEFADAAAAAAGVFDNPALLAAFDALDADTQAAAAEMFARIGRQSATEAGDPSTIDFTPDPLAGADAQTLQSRYDQLTD
ncbi:MAG: hypothetical protein CMM61_12065, partial [Rhodospirillaceae bacterium]|nr:hypothetical protein [Rhodospirillaceae bacterium]